MNIANSTVSDFQNDGVVVLRGVFRDWVEPLSQGVAEVMAHPSPLERSYQPKDGSAPFFQDLCNWQRIPAFRAFVFDSPAAEIAARLMGSPTVTVLSRPYTCQAPRQQHRHTVAPRSALLLRGG